MSRTEPTQTPLYARLLLPLVRPFPDFDFFFVKSLRRRAVALMRLAPGDRVLDLGCGIGGSFPALVGAIGTLGDVVAVDISPAAVAAARRRVRRNGWTNVGIIEAPAETASLSGRFAAALMFAAPDVYGSPKALANVLAHLSPGARVVIFGVKTASHGPGVVLNPLLRWALGRLSFAATPLPEACPWRLVAEGAGALTVEEHFLGTLFLAAVTRGPVPTVR